MQTAGRRTHALIITHSCELIRLTYLHIPQPHPLPPLQPKHVIRNTHHTTRTNYIHIKCTLFIAMEYVTGMVTRLGSECLVSRLPCFICQPHIIHTHCVHADSSSVTASAQASSVVRKHPTIYCTYLVASERTIRERKKACCQMKAWNLCS
jgi:hypothetical protein